MTPTEQGKSSRAFAGSQVTSQHADLLDPKLSCFMSHHYIHALKCGRPTNLYQLLSILVGGFLHPSEKYYIVKLERISPRFGMKIPKNIWNHNSDDLFSSLNVGLVRFTTFPKASREFTHSPGVCTFVLPATFCCRNFCPACLTQGLSAPNLSAVLADGSSAIGHRDEWPTVDGSEIRQSPVDMVGYSTIYRVWETSQVVSRITEPSTV